MNDDVVEPLLCGMLLLEVPRDSLPELSEIKTLGPLLSIVLELEVKSDLDEVAQVCGVLSFYL